MAGGLCPRSKKNRRKEEKEGRKEGRKEAGKGCEPYETEQECITYIFLAVATCFINLCVHGRSLQT